MTKFRKRLREAVAKEPEQWNASRRLVSSDEIRVTIQRLRMALGTTSLDPLIRESLLAGLLPGETAGLKGISGEALRSITGLNPTKAIRNLCLFVGLSEDPNIFTVSGPGTLAATARQWPGQGAMSQEQIESAVRATENPFDLLLTADVASVVDFGAGDLTFEEQLVEHYLPRLEAAGKELTLHCMDRLDPTSETSALVKAGEERLKRLRQHPSSRLQFRFVGNQDMFAQAGQTLSRYTIAVCHSPASPTFAYEPCRISREAIDRRLHETKGEFRRVMKGGGKVLEVRHGGEWLTFPAWKFDIYGPLALLDLLSRNGKLCVMGAIDTEVFWEILSQLLPDDSARPRDQFYTEDNVRKYFGQTYEAMAKLAVGEKFILTEARQDIPRVLGPEQGRGERYGFRYVEVRRGALFPGMPAGRTAYVFEHMTRETAPWLLVLVPSV